MAGSIIDIPTVDRIPTMHAVDYYRAWEALEASAETWRRVRELTDCGATQDEAFAALRVSEALHAE